MVRRASQGQDTKIEWFVYNAGPSAMEAIFARSIDFTYVGPQPGGERLRARQTGATSELSRRNAWRRSARRPR